MYLEGCPIVCPYNYDPVCGSNGRDYENRRTFDNDCSLKMERCNGLTDIQFEHYGPCAGHFSFLFIQVLSLFPFFWARKYVKLVEFNLFLNFKELTMKIPVPPFLKLNRMRLGCSIQSMVFVFPVVLSACPRACAQVDSPVCASDGKTYANNCTLQAAIQCERSPATLAHEGKCPGM